MENDNIKVDKILLSFTAKPAKKGPQYMFNIPIQYIRDGYIKPEKTYRIYLQEIKEES